MRRKLVSVLMAVSMVSVLLMGCSSTGTASDGAETSTTDTAAATDATATEAPAAEETVSEVTGKAGVVWYNFADTFISNARQCLNNVAAADGTVAVTDADSQNDISTQDNNMSNFFTQDVDYLVLNNINNAATSEIVNQCKEKGVVTIFANTSSPSEADFANYEDLWYVSSASTQSGENMGNAIVEYLKGNENWDRNGNGKVDYILLQGMQTFSDTINRSSYSLAAIEGAGFTLGTCIGGDDVTGVKGGDSINGVICEFSRSKAQENVEALVANYGDDIDCILADNDDEALGAIAALQAHAYMTDDSNYIPVVGVDATAAGCEAIKNGTLLGTSLNNPVKLAKSIYKLMDLLASGEEVTTESVGIEGVNVTGHSIIIDYISITADNLDQASYDITDTSY
ncbi:MAG: galactose ABC transporter substrate-binding protein [Mobilitalea sp.]